MIETPSVDDKETVVRILHKEWIVDGQLQITAFALRITNPMPAFSLDAMRKISKEGRKASRIKKIV